MIFNFRRKGFIGSHFFSNSDVKYEYSIVATHIIVLCNYYHVVNVPVEKVSKLGTLHNLFLLVVQYWERHGKRRKRVHDCDLTFKYFHIWSVSWNSKISFEMVYFCEQTQKDKNKKEYGGLNWKNFH